MKKKLLNIVKYIFFLGLGVFLVWLSMHKIMGNEKEWNEFVEQVSKANYWLIVPVFAILSLSHVLRALRWKILMEPMGYNPSFPNTFFSVMIGYLANMAVPRLGELLKCTILAKYEKVPAEKIVGTIVAERAFDVLSLGIVFLLSFILQFDVAVNTYHKMGEVLKGTVNNNPNDANHTLKQAILIAVIVVVAALFVWLLVTKRLQKFLLKLKAILMGIWEGLITARKLKHKKLFIFYSIGIWVLYLGGTWLGFYATSGTAGLSLSTAITCLAFASIGMIVTPGGIGAYAILLATTLELQSNPIPYPIGYANGTLQWFAQCIIVLVVGFVCLILLPWYNKKKMENSIV